MSVFELAEPTRGVLPDVMQVWDVRAPSASAFSSPRARVTIPQWRVNLPPDAREIVSAFRTLDASLVLTDNALAHASFRLEQFVQAQHVLPEKISVKSFASAPTPERMLSLMVNLPSEKRAFGSPFDWLGDWRQAIDEFKTFIAQLQQHVWNFAWVDTELAGARIALSRVNWLGDFQTSYRDDANTVQVELHQRALHGALGSRHRLLKQFVTVIHGAAQLATLALMATNPLLALPAALRFVKLLFEEYRKHQTE